MLNRVLLYCRPGFEGECVAEITDRAAELNIFGFGKTQPQSGFVNFECYTPSDAIKLVKQLPFRSMIFARQFFVAGNEITLESLENRIDPIIAQMSREIPLGGNLQVEAPDSDGGRALLTFCRKFSVPFRQKLRQLKRLTVAENNKKPTIHLFFTDNRHCYLGYSLPNNHSPFYMGIPRLKFPSDAPSRSTLKLEEAFHLFVPYEEWDDRLKGGLYAVDLGACPGGWTYQLVKRSMFVFAIDNGAMAPSLMETGQVKHYQEDGFKFEPERKNIYWLVCDMVEKPSKVSALMAKWLIEGWCREAIFNLKLPMKKRYDEVMENLNWIKTELTEHNVNFQIQAKHLYHDREEVTVHIQRIWG